MPQENLLSDMIILRNQAELATQSLQDAVRVVDSQREAINRAVGEYMAKRTQLFIARLTESGRTWCTNCGRPVGKGDVKLVLIEGAKEVSGGYENSCWGNEEFSELHRACPDCQQNFQDRHGTQGPYDTFRRIQAQFYAFNVEVMQEDEKPPQYWARKFGRTMELTQKIVHEHEPKAGLIDKMANELDLPPKLDTNHEYNSRQYGELIVREVGATR